MATDIFRYTTDILKVEEPCLTYSCEMMFGVEPPDDADDPAYTTVCYSQCALNNNIPDTTCSKLPSFEEVTL